MTGSSVRLSHLLEAGASPSKSKALQMAVDDNSTLIAHKLLAVCRPEEVAALGEGLVKGATRQANAELTADLLSHGALLPGQAIALALASNKPQEDVTRTLVNLLRRGARESAGDTGHPLLEAARRIVEDTRPATVEGLEEAVIGRLVGHEKDFVADKPVADPQHFDVELRRGVVVVMGRNDPAGQQVDVDMSGVASAASVSRTHVLLRFHDSRQVWQLHVAGRNGLFDERGRFFPPQMDEDAWIDLSVFPNNKFEVCWTKFEIKTVH